MREIDDRLPPLLDDPSAGPVPFGVQIQTVVGCNAACAFCPAMKVGQGAPERMADALFARITADLEGVVAVAPFLMNEPTLDPALVARVAMLRERWPTLKVALSTNAARLTPTLARDLAAAGLTHLTVSLYGGTAAAIRARTGLPGDVVLAHLAAAASVCHAAGVVLRVKVLGDILPFAERAAVAARCDALGVPLAVGRLHDRAGHVGLSPAVSVGGGAARAHTSGRIVGCADRERPHRVLHVLASGLVVLCCNDYGRQHVVGDLRRERLREVWTGPRYAALRARIAAPPDARPGVLCDGCALARWSTSD